LEKAVGEKGGGRDEVEKSRPGVNTNDVHCSLYPLRTWRTKIEGVPDPAVSIQPDALSRRINRLPKWARDYIHNIETFVGAEEVQELTFLRDQNKALIKLVAELKAENKRLRARLGSSKR
jgi:hypothetical protein